MSLKMQRTPAKLHKRHKLDDTKVFNSALLLRYTHANNFQGVFGYSHITSIIDDKITHFVRTFCFPARRGPFSFLYRVAMETRYD